MSKETVWNIDLNGTSARVSCVPQGNKYLLYLDGVLLTTVHRLPGNKMRFGLEERILIRDETCYFVVWDEIPDLVVRGHMVGRDTDYQRARNARLHNMEVMYTVTAVFGLVILAGVFLFAYFGTLDEGTIRGWTALMAAGIWMVVMGLYMRGQWIRHIPRDRRG